MVKVLFVCLGNICRSPMAEGVFQEMVNKAGLSDQIRVDSAGTSDYHEGESAHHGTLRILKQYGIDYKGRSRPLTRADFAQYDYILGMDNSNLAGIRQMHLEAGEHQPVIRLFLEYGEGLDVTEVPDPYYTGGFAEVYGLVENASRGLLNAIRAEHGL